MPSLMQMMSLVLLLASLCVGEAESTVARHGMTSRSSALRRSRHLPRLVTEISVQDHTAAEAFAASTKMRRHAYADDAEDDVADDDEDGAGDAEEDEEGATRREEREKSRRSQRSQRRGRNSRRNQEKIAELRQNIATISNKQAFDVAIAADVKKITNETASPGLANFLGNMAKEVRTMGAPDYIKSLNDQIDDMGEEEEKDQEQKSARERSEAPADEGNGSWEGDEGPEGLNKAMKAMAGGEEENKKKEQKKEKEGGKKEGKEGDGGENSGTIFAVSMMGTMALMSVAFGMARTANDEIRNNTLLIIDQGVAIFLAVLWFQAFDSLLDMSGIVGQYKVLVSVLYAVTALSGSVAIAFFLRRSGVTLAIMTGCISHFVSMSSVLAGSGLQTDVFVVGWYHPAMAFLGMICMVIFFALIGTVIWYVKRALRANGDEAFMDQTDALETNFGAMTMAFCFSLLVRFLITGYHPTNGKGTDSFKHNSTERALMFAYSVVALIAAAAGLFFMQRIRNPSYVMNRVVMFASAFLSMNVAWGWLLWGEWEFYETRFGKDPIFGKIIFAMTMSFAVAGMTVGLAQIKSNGGKAGKKVGHVAMGLLVAWSWAACFDHAVEDFNGKESHVAPVKLCCAAVLTATILPVYAWHLKPMTMAAGKALQSER